MTLDTKLKSVKFGKITRHGLVRAFKKSNSAKKYEY